MDAVIQERESDSTARPSLSEGESCAVPERSSSERWITLAVFLLSVCYLSFFLRFTTIEPDEGILLQGAQRILLGQVMYRDFFSFLTPGSFYLHAALFQIFGNSFMVARTWLAVNGGVFSVIFYLLSRRVCSRFTALIAVTLLTITTVPFRFLTLHNWDSTLFACLGVYSAVRVLESGRGVWIFALGSFVSMTTLFEQSKGVGLGLGMILGFAALRLGYQGCSAIGFIAPFAASWHPTEGRRTAV